MENSVPTVKSEDPRLPSTEMSDSAVAPEKQVETSEMNGDTTNHVSSEADLAGSTNVTTDNHVLPAQSHNGNGNVKSEESTGIDEVANTEPSGNGGVQSTQSLQHEQNGVSDNMTNGGSSDSHEPSAAPIDHHELKIEEAADSISHVAETPKKRTASESSDGSKKRKQAVLNFSSSQGHTSLGLASTDQSEQKSEDNAESDLKAEDHTAEDNDKPQSNDGEFLVKLSYKKAAEPRKTRAKNKANEQPQEKVRNFERAAKKPLPKEQPLHLPLGKFKKAPSKSKPPPGPTTILRENNRNARPLPGPLVPLNYDLYDGNVVENDANKIVASASLAFGFPLKPNPNSYDIMYILLFLSKFEPIVQAGPLGPDDFEKGLDLENDLDSPQISQTMEVFFRRLLVLLLNRKKAIPKDGQRPAIQELQTKYVSFGLPEEWRDDSNIKEVDSFPCVPENDIVDPSKPPVAPEDLLEYEGPKEITNVFHSKRFEDFGLAGIESSRQRVILLRTMVVWCLSVSLRIKTYLTSIVSKQEVPGERDNIYVSRAVMNGFSQTLESKKDHEVKVARKTKPTTKGGLQDFDLRLAYMDPTSNPMTHPLALRLNEFVAGDIGFHVGRFYLVRLADASAGGLGSLTEMKQATKLQPGDRSMATNFRLYVEDVYSLLEQCLRVEGVEFNSEGEEVAHDLKYDDTKYWYTVASNYKELQAFTDLIGEKLANYKTHPGAIPPSSDAYRPLLYMYQYLCHVTPIIGELEGLYAGGSGELRSSRKKAVSYKPPSHWEAETEDSEKRGDEDYSEGGEEAFEDEEDVDEGEEAQEDEEEEEAEFLD